MKRRDFIKMGSFMTVSAATLGVTGCSLSDDETASSVINRPAPAAATGGNWQFPQSIASGDPKENSIVLWTRVVPSSLGITDVTTTNVSITLLVTTTDQSANLGSDATEITPNIPAGAITVPAFADFDGTARHKLTGLNANTTYFYQFKAGTKLSKVGRFKTAQAATDSNNVKFAFMSCQDWSANHWGAFSQIVTDDGVGATPSLDFVVHLGDYIYETDSASADEALHSAIVLPDGSALPSPSTGKYAASTKDYRYLYKLYRSDARIQAFHERFPIIAVWDDHEFSDDAWKASETYTNDNFSQPTRRRNASQAWFEFMPADITYSETETSIDNIKIYRDLKFGTTMHLVMTDERLYKNDHLIAETTLRNGVQLGRINSRYLAPEASLKQVEFLKSPSSAPAGTDALALVSVLGQTQRDWWKSTMSNSTSTWKVWGNEVSLMRMGLHGTNALAGVISLGIFGALTGSSSSGISEIPAQLSAGLGAQLATSPATPATTTIVVALTPQLVGAGLDAATAQALATSTATAVAVSAAGGGDDTAKTTAAYNVLFGAGIPDPQATGLAGAAVAVFNRALAVGNLVIAAAVTGAVGTGATTPVAGQAAYAITARSASSTNIADLVAAGTAAGLNATQAQAAAGAFLNAIAVGNITIASAVAGAGTANADSTVAGQAALAITATDANPAADTAARVTAAQTAGLTAKQAETAVAAYEAAKAALPAGAATQIQSAANQIAFVKASPDMKTNKATSPFFLKATGASAAAVAGFFQKFIINADQWDGYRKERTDLMTHLLSNGIQNVVAVTGDIHAFFAGQVYDRFAGEVLIPGNTNETLDATAGTAVMVDLVTAGVSSTSWFNYLKEAADGLDPTNALIGKLVYVPVPVALPANALFAGSPALNFTLNLNTLDYTMGKSAPPSAASLAGQLNDQLKRRLAAAGIPEAGGTLDASVAGVQANIAASPSFASALGLAQTLATAVQANPWLKHVDTEAQGYAVVTATAATLTCEFKKLNPIVGTAAPSAARLVRSTVTATVTAGTADVVIS